MSPLRIVSILIIVLGAIEISPECAARIFLTGRNYPSGDYPAAAAVQDFNNDGISDIASANEVDKNVSVFLGNPDGTFNPANTFPVGAGAIEIASSDLNGDGNADLVVTDGIKSAYVVLGNGDGTFGSSSKIALHNDPIGIAIAELNGDGILDLAIANFGPENNSQGEAAILIGVGDGTFAAPVYYPLTHNGVRLVAIDLNHDGKLDLAVAVQHFSNAKNALAVLFGNGDGTFQNAVTSISGSSDDVAAADFNADGNVDLALAGDGKVRIVLGNGDGTFQPVITYSAEGSSDTVAIADLNRDGLLDLLVGGDHTVIFLGNGDGTFDPPVLYAVGNRFARIGYFNRDRDADVVAGAGYSEIGVAFGRGDGTLRAPRSFDGGAWGFDSGDFDGDGHADVVDGVPLSFLRGVGDGTFAPGVPIADLDAERLVATDFNLDGKSDLLVCPFYLTGIYTLLGNGDGSFQEAQFTELSIDEMWPAVADFNNDGQLDIALTGVNDDKLSILLGKGDGTFEPEVVYRTDDGPQSPIAADFNGDGNPDLAISNVGGPTVAIYLGHGDGTFASPLNIVTRNPIYSAAADFNQDGKVDFVLGGDGLKLFLGNGDGTFQVAQTIYADYGPVKVADLDLDGRLDITVSGLLNFDGIVALRGKGDGTFGSGAEFPTGSLINGYFALGDLNGDARPEAIVSTGGYTYSLTVLLNIAGRR